MSGGAATNTPPFHGAIPAAQSRPSAKMWLSSNRPSPSLSRKKPHWFPTERVRALACTDNLAIFGHVEVSVGVQRPQRLDFARSARLPPGSMRKPSMVSNVFNDSSGALAVGGWKESR